MTTDAAAPLPQIVRDGADVGPPPEFDPECLPALAAAQEFFPEPVTHESVLAVRPALAEADPDDEALERGGAYTVHERNVPGLDGDPDVPITVLTPTQTGRPTAALYYLHAGGMLFGGQRSDLDYALGYAEAEGIALVGVGYRLAPEHPHPAPVHDAYAGLLWLSEHAAEFTIDPSRIVIFGVSAGGGLAAAVALMCRDLGGPRLLGQMLSAPMLDERNDTVSSFQFQGRGAWIRESNEYAWNALLGDGRRGEDVSPYASPARATDLSGLPPALIDVGTSEVFRDETVDYARRIWAQGGRAELHVWPGGYHAFDTFAPTARISRAAGRARAEWLHHLLN